jgi:exopolyphosphatase/guanosine-5'-triphosphate,3'-diphosphate pyrophosphatase
VRVAAADLGTNTTRLLVADVAGDGRVDEVLRLLEITRLGEGVDASGRLSGEAAARTLAVVRRFGEAARANGAERLLAAATSAVRDAVDGAAFLAAAAAETGFETRLLTGEEEARATLAGVLSDRSARAGRIAVVDVGGGSTEISVSSDGAIEFAVSADAGSVRATERWLGEETVADDALTRARGEIDTLLRSLLPAPIGPLDETIAVAGTATTLAALDLGLDAYDPERIHGHRLASATVELLMRRLAAMTTAGRRALPSMEPGRAPVIVGGALVLAAALERLGATEATVSERDLMHGIALLAAGP